jgi:hypothetical protein
MESSFSKDQLQSLGLLINVIYSNPVILFSPNTSVIQTNLIEKANKTFELLEKIINGKGWDTGSRIFPKISMCDFRIREVGNPKVSHRYTVQCVLPINLFNQQICKLF